MDSLHQKIGILGAGQMGAGIAQTAAQVGFKVTLADRDLETAKQGKESISRQLRRQVEKGKLTESEQEQILDRIQLAHDLKGLNQSDLVIEAVTEKPDLKFEIFRQLDDACPPHTLL